jgi:imidazole glycerol-phosphate synthase subunit HisH
MRSPKVTIIDYGFGNILSVQRAFETFGAEVLITDNPNLILSADRLVLPGVGAFRQSMLSLAKLDLINAIVNFAKQGKPLLGICLGMQLLYDESEEFAITKGLGLVSGRIVSIPEKNIYGEIQKKPHIGWTELQKPNPQVSWENTILQETLSKESFYFIHSYMVKNSNSNDIISTCRYGGCQIVAAINKANIFGCQFHPEKSGAAGLKIIKNFLLI